MPVLAVHIVSAVPDLLSEPIRHSILGRAQEKGLVDVRIHDLRDHSADPHRQIDDYPFGGGGGMVLKPEPIFRCIETIQTEFESAGVGPAEVIYLTPDGTHFDQRIANELSLASNLILLAGHYKGIDQRVRDELVSRELSIGDYVLSGGEFPALVVLDAVTRLIPGVLGDAESALTDSFQDGLLGAPVYTRPAVFRDLAVPDVLRSGDHDGIREWRESRRIEKTKDSRPDLIAE